MASERDIEANLNVIRMAIEASKEPTPSLRESSAQARKEYDAAMKAHKEKQEELGLAAVQSAFLLGAMFLSDMHRIADCQEIMAKHVLSGGKALDVNAYNAMFNKS